MKYFNNSADGIRGITIIFVILFHSNIRYYKQCFIGVDLTFLLSGYLLMKSHMHSDKEYAYYNFYLKRLSHILPAFSLFMLMMFLYHISNGIHELRIIKEYLYSSLFISNIYFKHENEDYFFLVNPSKLLHTWSLSIEIQFYILFSLFIYIYQRNYLIFMIIVSSICINSFLYEIYNIINKETIIYYSLFSRLWEFIIGIIVGMNKQSNIITLNTDVLVLLLLLIPFINISINITLFRVIELLLCLIILENGNNILEEESSENKDKKRDSHSIILNNKVLNHIGKLSYILYLIHYPIFRTRYSIYNKLILIYILSVVFYKIIEYSFNKKKSQNQQTIIMLMLFLLSITPIMIVYIKFNLISSYLIYNSNNNETNFHSKINISSIPINVLSQYKSLRLDLHSFDNTLNYSNIEYIRPNDFLRKLFEESFIKENIDEKSEVWNSKPIAYIIGDSYCMQWMGVVKKYCSERNITLVYAQILMKDFLKYSAKEFMKEIIREDMIKERNIHFDIIFIAFSLNMKLTLNLEDKYDVQYPILINSLYKYTDEIFAFEGTPHNMVNSYQCCYFCVYYKQNRCYTILGKNESYAEHYQPIYLSNYHTIDFYEKQFCYNNICSCVINNNIAYDVYVHVNPSVLKLFQNEFDDFIDRTLKSKFKKVKQYNRKDKHNLYVIGYIIQKLLLI